VQLALGCGQGLFATARQRAVTLPLLSIPVHKGAANIEATVNADFGLTSTYE